jgi:hypothetical protein
LRAEEAMVEIERENRREARCEMEFRRFEDDDEQRFDSIHSISVSGPVSSWEKARLG